MEAARVAVSAWGLVGSRWVEMERESALSRVSAMARGLVVGRMR